MMTDTCAEVWKMYFLTITLSWHNAPFFNFHEQFLAFILLGSTDLSQVIGWKNGEVDVPAFTLSGTPDYSVGRPHAAKSYLTCVGWDVAVSWLDCVKELKKWLHTLLLHISEGFVRATMFHDSFLLKKYCKDCFKCIFMNGIHHRHILVTLNCDTFQEIF